MTFNCTEIKCWSCKTSFWIPNSLYETTQKTRNNDNRTGCYCPYGHYNVWKSDNQLSEEQEIRLERDRLRQKLAQKDDSLREERERREAAERSASAFKGSATRVKNRAKHGVCPCCNRTFKQLAQHMKTKHPHYQADADVIDLAKKVRERA